MQADHELAHMPLISGMPDDLAILCLARVPRGYHHILKCVSKRWRLLMCSEELWFQRHKHNLDECWIYAICRNSNGVGLYLLEPSKRCWKHIQKIPSSCVLKKGMVFQVIGKKLYLLGGAERLEDEAREVYCYDASTNSWGEACPMPSSRVCSACETVNGKLYVIGCSEWSSTHSISWEMYDPSMNLWTTNSGPNLFYEVDNLHRPFGHDGNIYVCHTAQSFVLDGKIYVRRINFSAEPAVEALVLNPTTSNTWQPVVGRMVTHWCGPIVVVDGALYMLDQSMGLKLMMWNKEMEEWVALGRLSTHRIKPPCHLVAVRNKIYVIGYGLSTVIIDVSKLGNAGGIIISSSLPGLDSVQVISCKSVAL